MNDPDINFFGTFDIYLASVLITVGFSVDSLDTTNYRKVEFLFRRIEGLDDTIQRYWAKELLLEPQALFANQKFLKNRIYST